MRQRLVTEERVDGVVPTIAFKRLVQPLLGKMLQPAQGSPDETLVLYLKAGHVGWGRLDLPEELPEMWATETDIYTLHPKVGDLLICEGGEVGRATVIGKPLPPTAIVQNSLHLVRQSQSADVRYLRYALEHAALSGWLDILCNKATIAHLTNDKLRDLRVPFHIGSKQTRIANFLDEQTARINALIAEKERLDVLLGEYRGSLISAAVTGYLDVSAGTAVPKTEKRNEPVTNCQLKHLASMKSGESISSDEILQDGPYPVYGGNGLRGYTGNYTHAQTGPLIGRQGALCGNVTFVSGAFWATEHAIVATPREGVWPRWLFWLLEGLDLNQYSVAAAQPGLAVEALTRVRTVKPQFSTQVRIANFLDEQTARIDDLRNHCREHIALLREYRSSLISAAVTGQLDIDSFEKGVA